MSDEKVPTLRRALEQVLSLIHNLPRSATADKIDTIARAALAAEEEGGMRWAEAAHVNVDNDAYYVVQTNGMEWRDFDLAIWRGHIVNARLNPEYARGRPVWIAKIIPPAPKASP